MELIRQFEATGLFLFRFRSQIPVLTLLVFFLVMRAQGQGMTSKGFDLEWELACLVVSMIGYGIRIKTVAEGEMEWDGIRIITLGSTPEGTSGRNRHHQVAHVLNTTGMYSVVRNPLYLGNFIIFFGISLVPRLLWVVGLNSLLFWLFFLPIMFAEEQYLDRKFGDAFHAWARLTPSVIPRFCMWRPAALPYSVLLVVQREYQTLCAIVGYFALLAITGDYVQTGHLVLKSLNMIVFLVTLVVFLVTRVLVKNTRLFAAPESEPLRTP